MRESRLLVDHATIEEVRIKKIQGVAPDRYRVLAVAVPVLHLLGNLIPTPMMAMYFIQTGGDWKYAFR